MIFRTILALLLFLAPSFAAMPLSTIDITNFPKEVAISLILPSVPQYKFFSLSNPDRLVLDISDIKWSVRQFSDPNNLITNVRHAYREDGKLRIVFDLARQPVKIDSEVLKTAGKHTLILHLHTPTNITPTNDKPLAFAPLAKKDISLQKPEDAFNKFIATYEPQTTPPKKLTFQPSQFVIVIDPGHGGADPGASSLRTNEKTLTLTFAMKLKQTLERNKKFKVILTRSTDQYMSLSDRVGKARKAHADLFISLHADYCDDPSVSGSAIYTLAEKASDKEAERLAALENQADIVRGVELASEHREVANMLFDMVARQTNNTSAEFAGILVKGLSTITKMNNNSHRFAAFRVLRGVDVPAILLELGFLSNKKDVQQLNSPLYQAKITQGIARAVEKHFISR